ncbi:hypothetical protein [Lysobacter gummosus]
MDVLQQLLFGEAVLFVHRRGSGKGSAADQLPEGINSSKAAPKARR